MQAQAFVLMILAYLWRAIQTVAPFLKRRVVEPAQSGGEQAAAAIKDGSAQATEAAQSSGEQAASAIKGGAAEAADAAESTGEQAGAVIKGEAADVDAAMAEQQAREE